MIPVDSGRIVIVLDNRRFSGCTPIAATIAPTTTMKGTTRMSKPEFFDTPGYGKIAHTRNHYSQALRIGDRIEIAGQGGWDDDFTLSATSLEDEIVKACDNVEKTLAETGASWRDVVNIHSYHVPTADDSIGDEHMAVMVDQFRKRFGESLPLWTAVGVKALALPDQHVEIEVVAIAGSGSN
jgi:enamine deaminase RidA (YjgF/YER057c/UK114 family)